MIKRTLFTLVALAAVFCFQGSAEAVGGYRNAFNTQYGTVGTALDTCTLCHTGSPSAGNVNVFGNAYANAGYSFTAIQNLDSDGDGFTNIAEINARTFPGNAASKPAGGGGDTVKPTVTAFTLPATVNSMTVTISSLVATDNVGVTGYMITTTPTKPVAGDAGWTGTPPANFTFTSLGLKTLYAWAKDAAGNVSASRLASVTILPAANTVTPDIGFFLNGVWKLDTNGDTVFSPLSDTKITFGAAGVTAVTGRWTAGGVNKVGTFNAGKWKLDLNGDGIFDPATEKFTFGVLGDKPIVGDWNGDGIDDIGVYRAGKFILDLDGNRVLDQAEIDGAVAFGLTGGKPVAGNWTGTGVMVGIFKAGTWYLDMNGDKVFDQADGTSFTFGVPGDMPVVGDWDGDGITDIGVYRPANSKWYLDMDGSHSLDLAADLSFKLGALGAQPVVAK